MPEGPTFFSISLNFVSLWPSSAQEPLRAPRSYRPECDDGRFCPALRVELCLFLFPSAFFLCRSPFLVSFFALLLGAILTAAAFLSYKLGATRAQPSTNHRALACNTTRRATNTRRDAPPQSHDHLRCSIVSIAYVPIVTIHSNTSAENIKRQSPPQATNIIIFNLCYLSSPA